MAFMTGITPNRRRVSIRVHICVFVFVFDAVEVGVGRRFVRELRYWGQFPGMEEEHRRVRMVQR